jgi:hypothetical protein
MIMWENTVQPDRPQKTIQRMSFARWITKATYTHSECVIFLFYGNNFYANAPRCCVVRTSPVVLQQDIPYFPVDNARVIYTSNVKIRKK